MVSNNRSCLYAAAQYMLLFLVLTVNFDRFQILRSYTLLLYGSWSVLASICSTTEVFLFIASLLDIYLSHLKIILMDKFKLRLAM